MRFLWSVFLVACASSSPPPSQPVSGAVLDEWVERRTPRSAPSIRVSAAEHRARVAGRQRTARVRAHGSRIDVAFRRAPLTEALRLLADEARLQLVVADELPGEVNLSLRAVRPYDAMLALAQAHGADVLRNGDLVIVRAR